MDVSEWKNYCQRMTPPPVHIEAVLIDDRPAGGAAFPHSAAPTELLVPPGKRLAAGGLYRGRPAVRVRDLGARDLEMLRYSAAHYVRLKDRYLAGG